MGLSGEPISSPPSASQAELDAAFDAILKSETFSKAYAIRSVLRYLWDHRESPIDEYSIAVHALNRRPDFDPKSDSAVRVSMARLRGKLKEFYEAEGRDCSLLLWIPRHGFELEYQLTNRSETVPHAEPPPQPRERHPLLVPLLTALSLIAVVAAYQWQRVPPAQHTAARPAFWQRFLAGGDRVLTVLPDTLFLQWKDGQLSAGDSAVDAFSTWTSSAALKELTNTLGQPTGWTNYVSIPDALANIRLGQYIERLGASVRVLSSHDLAVDSFVDTNVVLIGLPSTSYQVQSKLAKLDFRIDAPGAVVRNLKPKPGELAAYQGAPQTGRRVVSYGILAVAPGRSATTRTLVLAAANPLFLLPMVSSVGPLAEVERNWVAAGSPPYFQGIVETISEGDSVLRIRLVAFRSLAN
jgi:hypothetical protein